MLKRFCRPAPLLYLAAMAHAQTSTQPGTQTSTQPSAPSAPTKVYPIQAELVSSLSTAKLKVGDTLLAKLKAEWIYAGCTLPRASAITGHVTALSLRSKTSRTTLSLLFDAPCGAADPQPLTWIALLAPDDSALAGLHDGNPVRRQAFRSATFGESGGIGQTGIESRVDMTGHQNPNFPVEIGPAPDRSHPRPTSVFTGQVWNLPDLKLDVASGPLGSSVLSAPKKDLHLAAGSVFVLSPAAPSATASSASPAISSTASPANTSPTAKDPAATYKDQCQPSTCTVVSRAASGPSPDPAQTLPLADLGYHRLKSAEMLDVEFGAALAYLGPDHLLFTFNPHTLVPRQSATDPADHPHMVRAVLFSLRTSAIESVSDWRVADDRQYLWPIAADRILVHSGDRLRLLALVPTDPGLPEAQALPARLQELASVSIPTRLAFVRHAPDQRHIAVGIIRELHTPEVHARLAEATSNAPEEEVSVLLLNGDLKPLGSFRQSSYALPPILSDTGRVTLLHAGGEHWRYAETTWSDQTGQSGQTLTLARLTSACIPEMSTLSADLFFVTGCDFKTVDRWYRILRSDGTAVLKGSLLSQDLQPLPAADASGDTVALALPSAHVGYLPNSPFHGADLSGEVVRVFRSTDGRAIFTAGLHAPTPTRQPVAFAPDGRSLAVLDGDRIVIYPLQPSGEPSPQPAVAASPTPSTLP